MNDITQDICELCEGEREMPDVEWDDDVKAWVEAGTRPCICVIQELEEEKANE